VINLETNTEVVVMEDDIDELGHVNNSIYGFYLEKGRSEWYKNAELSFEEMARRGIATVVLRLDILYLREAKVGDRLRIQTVPGRLGNTSFVLKQVIFNQDEQKITEATVTSVMIDREFKKSIPVAKEIANFLEEEIL
jgi:YbgC/YbaW family acyl-CoA thioester hydrolase